MYLRALSLITLSLMAAPAAGAQQGLDPGFWIFPQGPALSAGALSALCQHGMTLVQEDGRMLTFLADVADGRQQLVIDQESVCTAMSEGVQACATRTYATDGMQDVVTQFSLTWDAKGHRMGHFARAGRAGAVTSYPQMCPPAAVRDFMTGWLAVRAAP